MSQIPGMPSLDGLMELSKQDGVDVRPTLLRVTTDLYAQKPRHSPEEERQFTELVLSLIDLVDEQTRERVANKIVGFANAPVALRHRLLRQQIKVDASAPTLDIRPVSAPAADELCELFFGGSAQERRMILLNLPFARLKTAVPIPQALARESVHRMEAAALGHNAEVLARELERTLSISRTFGRRMIDDTSGEPIVVIAVALAMPASVLQRILLCLNAHISQSVQRVYELALLHEEIDAESALRMIAIWQAAHPAQKPALPAHQPQQVETARDQAAALQQRPKIRWEDHAQPRKAGSA